MSHHLLLLDSNAVFRKKLATPLEGVGYLTTATGSINKAIKKIREAKVEVALCRYELPEDGCADFLNAVRESNPDVPVIVFAKDETVRIAVKVMQNGAFDFISDERILQELEEKINAAIAEHDRRTADLKLDYDFQVLLDNIPDIIFGLDTGRRFQVVSPSVETVLGYKPDELIGTDPFMLMPEEDRGQVQQFFNEIIDKTESGIMKMEFRLMTKSGEVRNFEVNRRLRIRDDGSYHVEGVARDITERKRLEAELKEYSEQLESKVEERTENVRFASEQLSALNQVSIALTRFTDEDSLLEAAPKLLTESLDFDRSMLTLLKTDGSFFLRCMSAPHDTEELIRDFVNRIHSGEIKTPPHLQECIKENRSVFIEDLNEDPRWPKEDGEVVRTKSIVFTPLRVGGRVIGAISGNMQHHSRRMDEKDIERLETFANMVGLALDNIRAYRSLEDKVIERTQSLQESKESLARSIEEMQAILNVSAGSMVMVNREGRITARNDKVRKMFGLVEDPIRGTSFQEFLERIETCFKDKEAFHLLIHDLEKHAGLLYRDRLNKHEFNTKPFFERALKISFPEPMELGILSERVLDSNGNEIGRVWSFNDVTAPKRADTQLRTIIDASPIPLLVSRLEDGLILYANQPLADLIGVPREQAIDMMTPDFYAVPGERDRIRERLTTEGRIQHYEVQIKRQDGGIVWMLFNLEATELNGEQVVIGGLFDISERKQSEERLAKRFRYEEALATCTQALLTGEDTDQTLQTVLEKLRLASNATSVYIFKYFEEGEETFCRMMYEAADPRHEKSGMDAPHLQRLPVDHDNLKWQQIIQGGLHEASVEDPDEEARENMLKSGTKSMLNLPIFIEGVWYGFLGFVDVEQPRIWTDDDKRVLKTAAEMIGVYFYKKKVLTDLEDANRKIREAQLQLVQTEKMASLGMLVAGVAHEINTPVGALSSMHQTMTKAYDKLRTMLSEEGECLSTLQKPQVEATFKVIDDANKVINNGAQRVTEIVRRLRSFARLDEAERTRANIHEGIENTLTLIHHEIKHTVTVHKEFGDIPEIVCYPGQLNQVFLNILVNAKQAMEEKGEITIRTGMENDMVRIDISDTGKGIPKENLERIFDPGFTTKGVGIGTGLGLSIVYQIIQAHSGKICATSEVGKGTTFTILLPTNLAETPNNSVKKEDKN